MLVVPQALDRDVVVRVVGSPDIDRVDFRIECHLVNVRVHFPDAMRLGEPLPAFLRAGAHRRGLEPRLKHGPFENPVTDATGAYYSESCLFHFNAPLSSR